MSLRKCTLDEMRQTAWRLCRDYLTGKWKIVKPNEITINKIGGGLSNILYYVSLPAYANESASAPFNDATPSNILECNSETHIDESLEPREVLIRIYGQTHDARDEDALETILSESVVFALLSEWNFGPKLYGLFPGGRIEQYINARPLTTEELAIPNVSKNIAEKMAEIHVLNMPVSKEPDWLWKSMDRWLKNIDSILNDEEWILTKKQEIGFIRNFNFVTEMNWLRSQIAKKKYPVHFCHNDFQEGNILLMHSTEGISIVESKLRVIDFEYCAYNYRGFDLANHFLEWTFDYTNPEFPYYYHLKDKYPTKQQQTDFILTYLRKLNERLAEKFEPELENIESVLLEVKLFNLASHLFWGLWSVVMVNSPIEFGYWEYSMTRIQEYKINKKEYLKENNPRMSKSILSLVYS